MLVDSVVYLMEVNNFMSSYNTRKRLCRLALCLGIVAACIMVIVLEMIAGFPPVHAAPLQSLCQSFYVPVALGSGLPVQYEIYGELCNPSSGPSRTVQLLVPGATYGHVYWDFPYQPETYSYVHALNAAGYSTFNIDRIGIGKSSHPPIGLLTVAMPTNAYVVHEVVQALRSGSIGTQPFAQVLLVGHSLGSAISWIEASTYHDVDGVIISGLLHLVNATSVASVVATLYAATLDPRFAADSLNLNYIGYLTTEPGTRGRSFYYLPNADPEVIATDEATKETVTPGEVASFPLSLADDSSALIQVPVLVVVGQQDSLLCGVAAADCSSSASVQQTEAPFYAPQAQLQVAVIPNAGHDLNLHKNASLWFSIATQWAYAHVAP
jgi:pimeloyl-ACP methyl ester carboxylesterase